MKNAFYLTQVPFFHALVTKIQGGDTDITVNNLELVIPCKTCECLPFQNPTYYWNFFSRTHGKCVFH